MSQKEKPLSGYDKREEIKSIAEVREKLKKASKMLEELKVEYEQYFLGITKFSPDAQHAHMKRVIRYLQKAPFRNSEANYKLRMLERRYQSYNSYWMRVMREREAGTYSRDVFKAELRARLAAEAAEATSEKGKVKGAVKSLFDTYKNALEKQSGKKMNIDYQKFQKQIAQQAKAFRAKNGKGKMSFKVVLKDGKVRVRAQARKSNKK